MILWISLASLEMCFHFFPTGLFYSFTKLSTSVFHNNINFAFLCSTCKGEEKVLLIEPQDVEQKRSSKIVPSKLFRRGNIRVKYLPLLTSAPVFCLYLFYEKTLSVISCVALDKLLRTLWLSWVISDMVRRLTTNTNAYLPSFPPCLPCKAMVRGWLKHQTENIVTRIKTLTQIFEYLFSSFSFLNSFLCHSSGTSGLYYSRDQLTKLLYIV